jgi:hypothetical protein
VRFFLDHDVPDEVYQLLLYWKHDVHRLRDTLPGITPDPKVFAHAQEQAQIIVTCNRGHFLALAKQAIAEARSFAGLIILIRRRTRQAECAHLLSLIRRAGESGLTGNINLA